MSKGIYSIGYPGCQWESLTICIIKALPNTSIGAMYLPAVCDERERERGGGGRG